MESLNFNSSNSTSNESSFEPEPGLVFLDAFLCLVPLLTICGNTFVILAVATQPYLKSATNYMLASLALSDLIVGLCVMPFSIMLHMTSDIWPLGLIFCDIWHATDIWASTASIWNLCCISIDRFFGIRDPIHYHQFVTKKRATIAMLCVWSGSAVIALPPIFWWRKYSPHLYEKAQTCTFPDDSLFICLSSFISFYLPSAIMLFAYAHVYQKATEAQRNIAMGRLRCRLNRSKLSRKTWRWRKKRSSVKRQFTEHLRIHRGNPAKPLTPDRSPDRWSNLSKNLWFLTENGTGINPEEQNNWRSVSNSEIELCHSMPSPLIGVRSDSVSVSSSVSRKNSAAQSYEIDILAMSAGGMFAAFGKPRGSNEECVRSPEVPLAKLRHNLANRMSRFREERKAAKIISIVMGCFFVCWLPFFIVNVLSAICPSCIQVLDGKLLFDIVSWLGYCNSFLNPFIYTSFNGKFRKAFRMLRHCRKKSVLHKHYRCIGRVPMHYGTA